MRNSDELPWIGIADARNTFKGLGDKNFDECFSHIFHYPPCNAKPNMGFLLFDEITAEIKSWPHTPQKK